MKRYTKSGNKGFTIVELLIVIVVIAILAAISIVAYNGIQNRTADTVVKTDLANIAKKLEMTKIDLGRYPELLAEMPEYKLSKTSYDSKQNNIYLCVDKTVSAYAFGVRSSSGKGFFQTSSGLQEGVSSVTGVATCASIGKTWANDATTAVFQGYSPGVWNQTWVWTK